MDLLRATVFEKKPSFVMICESYVREDISDAWEQLIDFPTHIKDGMLDLVMSNRQRLVRGVRSD